MNLAEICVIIVMVLITALIAVTTADDNAPSRSAAAAAYEQIAVDWGTGIGYGRAACHWSGECVVVDVDRYPLRVKCDDDGCEPR